MAERWDGKQRYSTSNSASPRSPTAPTIEQLLYDGPGEGSRWSSSSPTFMRGHDLEDDHIHQYPNSRKSVLAKVKERARRWRLGLGKKRNADDGNTTPSWGVSLDEDDAEEDADYLGAPMYESELAPEDCKENARQHPRANPVISEKHLLPNSIHHETEPGKGNPLSPNKTMTETMTEKLAPAYAMVSDATQATTTKIQNAPAYATDATYAIASKIQNAPAHATDATHAVASKIQNLTVGSPVAGSAAGGPAKIAVRGHQQDTPAEQKWDKGMSAKTAVGGHERDTPAEQKWDKGVSAKTAVREHERETPAEREWDKGVSVTGYIMQKFEPGEDDRALSQVISEAISPRKGPGDAGVVEKVREAVSNLLRNQEASSNTAFHSAKNSSTHIAASTNAHEGKS
ncbi:uncharacterized protein J3R85_010891 [Psidium guajava]|nr:uncharacterized protein J3R85_010891 [Psidium guajava]